jgi:hypothetical protein
MLSGGLLRRLLKQGLIAPAHPELAESSFPWRGRSREKYRRRTCSHPPSHDPAERDLSHVGYVEDFFEAKLGKSESWRFG